MAENVQSASVLPTYTDDITRAKFYNTEQYAKGIASFAEFYERRFLNKNREVMIPEAVEELSNCKYEIIELNVQENKDYGKEKV